MFQPDPDLERGSNACEVSNEGKYRDVANAVHLRSIALSLKRIADALHYEEDGITTILTDLADK